MRLRLVCIAVPLLVGEGTAYAQDGAPAARHTAVKATRELGPVTPTLRVSGSTSGQVKLTAGADFQFGVLQNGAFLRITPTGEVQLNSGSATILTTSRDEGTASFDEGADWSLGLAATFVGVEDVDPTKEERAITATARGAGYGACLVACTKNDHPVDSEDCEAFNAARVAETLPQNLDASKMCAKGRKVFEATQGELVEPTWFQANPPWALSLGGTLGRSRYRYVEESAAPLVLSEKDDRVWKGTVVAYFYSVKPKKRASIGGEGWVAFERAAEASSDTVTLCEERGMIGEAEVEQCRIRAAAAPTERNIVSVGAGFTVTSRETRRWRGSVVPTLTLQGKSVALGGQIPVYVNLADLGDTYKGEYKAMIRIWPEIRIGVVGDAFDDINLTLKIELRADRSIFPTANTLL